MEVWRDVFITCFLYVVIFYIMRGRCVFVISPCLFYKSCVEEWQRYLSKLYVHVCIPMCQCLCLKKDTWTVWHVHGSCLINLYTACSPCSYYWTSETHLVDTGLQRGLKTVLRVLDGTDVMWFLKLFKTYWLVSTVRFNAKKSVFYLSLRINRHYFCIQYSLIGFSSVRYEFNQRTRACVCERVVVVVV